MHDQARPPALQTFLEPHNNFAHVVLWMLAAQVLEKIGKQLRVALADKFEADGLEESYQGICIVNVSVVDHSDRFVIGDMWVRIHVVLGAHACSSRVSDTDVPAMHSLVLAQHIKNVAARRVVLLVDRELAHGKHPRKGIEGAQANRVLAPYLQIKKRIVQVVEEVPILPRCSLLPRREVFSRGLQKSGLFCLVCK